jgi:1,3,6,8-tetrahydroxynaphthalene synthase
MSVHSPLHPELQSAESGSPVLCRPAIWVPEYVITGEQTLDLAKRMHPDHPRLPLALRLISHTGVQKRHFIRPIDATLTPPGWTERMRLYNDHARRHLPGVVEEALANARVGASDVDAIVFVSCTGFTMPPLTAWMINKLGFGEGTVQVPIAQLGCAAGGAAINRAADFCLAHPGSTVLIVALEFCSLVYQPDDLDIGSLLSDGLFGDAIAAAVMCGDPGDRIGMGIVAHASHLVPDTEDWISYDVTDTGFHFRLDKRVPGTMDVLAPALHTLAESNGWDETALDFYTIHAGGPRILDDLSHYLHVSPKHFATSRATLTEYGNIASAVVLASLVRHFDSGELRDGDRGMLAGFGPGITSEACLALWRRPARHPPGTSGTPTG